jgi:hypothetical protein
MHQQIPQPKTPCSDKTSGLLLPSCLCVDGTCRRSFEHPQPLDQAIERCAEEPIQVPGSIQPQGFLLVLDEHDLRILQASENVEQWLGVSASELLGQALLRCSTTFDLHGHWADCPPTRYSPFTSGMCGCASAPRPTAGAGPPPRPGADPRVRDLSRNGCPARRLLPAGAAFISTLHQATSIEELLQRSVRQIKRITGFGRVKAYRFDAEGTGTVLAEDADPGYPAIWACASRPRTSRARPASCTASTASA